MLLAKKEIEEAVRSKTPLQGAIAAGNHRDEAHPQRPNRQGSRWEMPKSKIALLGLLLVGAYVSSAYAATDYGVAGEITLTKESHSSMSLSSSPANDNSTFAVTVTGRPDTTDSILKVTFNVCIQNGRFMTGDITHDLSETIEGDVKTQYKQTDCTSTHQPQKRDIRRPGNWTIDYKKGKAVFMTPEQANKNYQLNIEPYVRFTNPAPGRSSSTRQSNVTTAVSGLPRGKYRLNASTGFLSAPSSVIRHEVHNICTGTMTGIYSRRMPEDYGKPESGSYNRQVGRESSVTLVPFKKESLFGKWEIDYDPAGSSGSTNLSPPYKNNNIDRTFTASWSLKPVDPCERLANSINKDLAYAEGYLDTQTRRNADAQYQRDLATSLADKTPAPDLMKIYKCHVDRYAYERLRGSPPPPGQIDCDNPSTAAGVVEDLGVDANCNLVGEQAYRDRAKRNCVPDEVVEAVIVHERSHVAQCVMDKNRFNQNDMVSWGGMEAAAHMVGINEMLKSLKRLCPNYDTRGIESWITTVNLYRLNP